MSLNNEYDDLFSEQVDGQVSQLQSADFATVKDFNPERKAEAFKLSEKYKVPVEFVESNFDSFKSKNTEVRIGEYDDLAENYKKTAKFLSSVDNAALAKDDIDSLKKIEEISNRGFGENLGSAFMLGMSRMNESIANIPAATYDLIAWPTNFFLEKAGSEYRYKSSDIPLLNSGFGLKDYYKKSSEAYTNQIPEINESILKEAGGGNYEKAGEMLAYQVAANAPNQLFIIASALMGRPDVGMGGVVALSTSSNLAEMNEQGKDPAKSVPAQLAKGLLEGGTERLGTLGFIDNWGKSLGNTIAKDGYKEVMKSFAKTIAAGTATEASEEVVNSFASDFVDYSVGEFNGSFQDSLVRAAESGLVGGVSGGVMTGPAAIGVGVQKSIEVKQAEIDQKMYLDMQDGVLNSKLYKRLPGKMTEHINESLKDSPMENIYMSQESFKTYFQSKGLNPAEEANRLGLKEEFERASETGGDIVLPTGKWVSNAVGSEHYQGLKDDVRFSQDGQSVKEAREEQKAVREDLKKAKEYADQLGVEGSQIIDDVYNQLVESGTPKNQARQQAELFRFFEVMAERTGQSPTELYKKYGVKIQKSEAPQDTGYMQIPDVPQYDMSLDDNGMHKYDETVLNMIRRGILEGESGGTVLPDGTRTQSTFPEFFKNKGYAKKSVLNIIDKHARGEMLSENQKEVLNDLYKGAVDGIQRKTFFQDKDFFETQYDAEYESIKIDNEQVKAIGTFATGEDYLEGFVNGPYKNKIKIEKLGLSGDEKIFSIEQIDVDRQQRRSGVGSKAIKSLEDSAQIMGAEVVVLNASPIGGNNKAKNLPGLIKFYESLGYKVIRKSKENAEMYKVLEPKKEFFQDALGATTFLENKTVISLFKEANQSTFLHEAGHLFLEVFKDLANSPQATDQIKKDAQGILEYLGAESWDKLEVKHHEKWARSFEAYLMKGEAPTLLLRKAFNTFKTWLTNIYKNVRNLDVEITPEITQIMDRMIASDVEINEAQEKVNLTQLFKDPIAAGMNQEMAEKYKEATERAREYAEAQLMQRMVDDLNKKQSKIYREKYDQYRSEAWKELSQRKIYDTVSVLKTGKHLSGVEAFPPVKIDKQSVIDQFGKEIADLMPKKVFAKDGNELDVSAVAGMFGFESVSEMVGQMTETAPIDDVSRQMANERIKIEFPDIYNEPEIKGEALMALHNEKRGEMLKLEMEFLEKNYKSLFKDAIRRTVRRSPIDQQVRSEARKIVGGLSVRDLKPHIYLRAEVKASKEAGIKLAKGDIKGAFEAKRLEYLNYEIYRAVTEAKADTEKSVKDFKKFFEKAEDLSKKRDIDLINAAKAILEKYGLSKDKTDSPFEYLKKMKEYDPQAYASIEPIIMDAIDGAANYESVSYDKFVEMKDVVLALWDMAKNVKQMQIDGQAVDIEAARAELSSKMSEHGAAPEQIKKDLTDGEKFKVKMLAAAASLRRVESWADGMDLGSFTGPFRKYIWQPVSQAVTDYRTEKAPVVDKYKQIIEKYKDVFSSQKIIADGLNNFTFQSKAHLLMAMLHTGNDSNKQKLIRGWGWGAVDENGVLDSRQFDEQIAQFQKDGVLTKRDYEFMQEIWDLMESLKPGAQRAHKKMFGYYFNEITAKEIETPFGTFKGGYIPAKVDVFTNEDSQIRKEREEFEQGNNSFQFPTTGKGFTKSRVESYAAPLALDMNLLMNHIDGVMRFTHIEPVIKQTARLIMNKEFRAELKNISPAAATEILNPWLQRTAQQRVTVPSQTGLMRAVDSAASALRTNVAMQFMVGNFTNAMQQVTGIAVAAAKVKPKHLLFGMKEYLANRSEMIEFVLNNSKYMKTIQDQTIYDSQEAIRQIVVDPNVFDKMKSFAKAHTYFLQSATQNFVNTIVWTGAYNQAVEDGMSNKQAALFADSSVRQTQGTNNPEDISSFEVGTPTYRLFTQFAGYFNMLTNLQTTEFQNVMKKMGLKKGAGRLTYLYFMTIMTPAVGAQLIVQLMSRKDFDEDEDGIADDLMALFFGSQAKTVAAQVPFVGQLGVSAVNRFNKNLADDRLSFSPVLSVLESGLGVPYAVYKDVENEELKKRTVKDFLNVAGMISGLPLGPVGRPVGYAMDVQSGEAQPSGPIDFGRGLISGQKGQ